MSTDPARPDAPWPEDLDPFVQATRGLQPWRRIFHMVSGLAMALLPAMLGWSRDTTLAVLFLLLLVAAGLDVQRLRRPDWNRTFFQLLRPLVSAREAAGIASSTWYLVGGFLTYLLFQPTHAILAILVLAVADPAAAVVGQHLGGRRMGTGSVSGTTTFFLVASVILWMGTGSPLTLLAALAVAVLETVPTGIDDNLVIPLSTGVLLLLLGV